MNTIFTVNFGDEVISNLRNLLTISQEEWVNTIGRVKMSDFYNFSYNVLSSGNVNSSIDCGLSSNGSCKSIIYAFPAIPDLLYQLHTSYGSLSSRSSANFVHSELLLFNMSKSNTLTYFPIGNVSYEWIGSVYDLQGNVRSNSAVDINEEGEILLPEKVYGTLKVKYEVVRHKYILEVFPREEETEDLFGAVVYGIYDEGIAWVELNNPPNLDDIASGSVSCGGLSSTSSDNTDDTEDGRTPTTAPKVNRKIITDYCTQEVLSDTTTYV